MKRSKRQYAVPQKALPPRTTKNKLPITKIDAARRQLETAITLWFGDNDPVSIHTLMMAATDILRALNKQRSGPSMLTEASQYIQPEYHEAYEELIVRSYQFFKHGAKDPDKTEWFTVGFNEPLMLDAVEAYFRIAGERPPILKVFRNYMLLHKRELFGGVEDMKVDAAMMKWPKAQFFFEMLPVATMNSAIPREESHAQARKA